MIVAIVQARMGSSRLPGKVLADIGGQPMLSRQLSRLAQASLVDQICVATTVATADDAVTELARSLGVAVCRGPADDVLERIWRGGQMLAATQIVRLTADCPLSDPQIIDRVISAHMAGQNDLTANVVERSFPDGLDVEVVTAAALSRARDAATGAADREHVTPFFYRAESGFRVGSVSCSRDLGAQRWTVDYLEDLEFVRHVFAAFPGRESEFSMDEVLALLEAEPSLLGINAMHRGL